MIAPRSVPVSVTVIAQNEGDVLAGALESVTWAAEIVVVDGGSTDDTQAIAHRFTDRVYVNPWPGYAAQKQYALDRATQPWVLSLDADERVSPELAGEIALLLAGQPGHDGYYLPRLSSFLGKPIRHSGWYPGWQLRLFRRERARLSSRRVHEGFIVEGSLGRLRGDLIHLTHRTLEASFDRLNRYSTLEALDRAGRRRAGALDIIFRPPAVFLKEFVVRRGFLDGMHGLALALVSAMVKMALYLKIWELQRRPRRPPA